MAEHTPGPWEISRETDGRRKGYIRAPQAAREGAPNPAVARVVIMPGWEANARLLAAAPDLLAACEQAIDEQSLGMYGAISNECIAALRAAIAKAKGGAG